MIAVFISLTERFFRVYFTTDSPKSQKKLVAPSDLG